VGTVAEIQHTRDPVVRQFIEGRPTLDGFEGATTTAGAAAGATAGAAGRAETRP